MAAQFFHQEGYIDAIRYSYLAVECLYANGQHKKKQTIEVLNASLELASAIETVIELPSLMAIVKRLQGSYLVLTSSLAPPAVLEWMYDLRGNIQHGNPASPRRWHPSRQEDFKDESLLLFNIAGEVCWKLAQQRLKKVETAE